MLPPTTMTSLTDIHPSSLTDVHPLTMFCSMLLPTTTVSQSLTTCHPTLTTIALELQVAMLPLWNTRISMRVSITRRIQIGFSTIHLQIAIRPTNIPIGAQIIHTHTQTQTTIHINIVVPMSTIHINIRVPTGPSKIRFSLARHIRIWVPAIRTQAWV